MSDDDSTKRREQIKLAADAPDDTWFRVKDKDTGHEYSIGKSAYDVNAHEILLDHEGNLRPGRAVDGTVLPAKPRVNLPTSLPSKNDSVDGADAGEQEAADAADASSAGATGAADSPSGQQSAAPSEKEKTR